MILVNLELTKAVDLSKFDVFGVAINDHDQPIVYADKREAVSHAVNNPRVVLGVFESNVDAITCFLDIVDCQVKNRKRYDLDTNNY